MFGRLAEAFPLHFGFRTEDWLFPAVANFFQNTSGPGIRK
jgi:hypothetical protein